MKNTIKQLTKSLKIDLAQSQNVLRELEKGIQRQGFAGDATIPKLTYLSAVSVLTPEPVSLVVMGSSGAGKSYSVDSGLQFVPDERIVRLTGMSDKFLAYAGDFELRNKLLFLGEASGMAEGSGRTFLRQLLTEGEINHSTVQKTKDGMKGEMLPSVKGPVGFVMTTTAGRIHHEDQSRMLQLNVVESPERTKEALLNKASGKSRTSIKIDFEPWHALYNNIASRPLNVLIPFAEDIVEHLPLSNPKIHRDFAKVLSLIKSCALLHQYTRERSEGGDIIASKDDYGIVFNLAKAALDEGLEESVPMVQKQIVNAIAELIDTNPVKFERGVSQSLVAEKIGRDRSVVSRNIFAAVSKGYIQNLNPGQGREAQLVVGDRKLTTGSVLPSPRILFETSKPADLINWPSPIK